VQLGRGRNLSRPNTNSFAAWSAVKATFYDGTVLLLFFFRNDASLPIAGRRNPIKILSKDRKGNDANMLPIATYVWGAYLVSKLYASVIHVRANAKFKVQIVREWSQCRRNLFSTGFEI
jgi:hypothetical protein